MWRTFLDNKVIVGMFERVYHQPDLLQSGRTVGSLGHSRAASLLDLSNLPGRDQWSGTEIDPIQLLFWVRIQLQMVDHVGSATRAHGPRQGEMTCLKRGEEFHPRIHPLTTTSAESSVEERSRLCSGAMSPTGGGDRVPNPGESGTAGHIITVSGCPCRHDNALHRRQKQPHDNFNVGVLD